LIDDLDLVVRCVNLGPLGLYEEIYNARAPCTSYATENIDYLTAADIEAFRLFYILGRVRKYYRVSTSNNNI